MASEKSILSTFLEIARRQYPPAVIIKRSDMFQIGIPDVEFSLNKRTTFIEFKFADPKFSSTGIQELTMLRLSNQSHDAIYVVYEQLDKKTKRTYIVKPRNFAEWQTKFEHIYEGFAHVEILRYLGRSHGIGLES